MDLVFEEKYLKSTPFFDEFWPLLFLFVTMDKLQIDLFDDFSLVIFTAATF